MKIGLKFEDVFGVKKCL